MKNEASVDRIIQINNTNIGKNIAELRKEKKLKQTEMVAKLQLLGEDLSIFSYNRIEKGTQNPSVSFLFACCQVLECDMNKIFGLKNP